MQLYEQIEGQTVFEAYNFERVVSIPVENREQLQDIGLAIWGKPQGVPIPNVGPAGTPRDVWIYFDGEDITGSVVAILKASLDTMNQNDVAQQYYQAMERFLAMERQLGFGSASSDLAQAENRAQTMAATRPLSLNLDRLGSRGLLAFHNLHIFNFLFTEIPAQPVSLKAVLHLHHQNGGSEIVLGSRAHTLVLSTGSCRLFSGAGWTVPTVDLLGGELRYRLTLAYHNPLEDILESLEQNISARLDEISTQIGSSGIIIRQLLPAIDQRLTSIETDLNVANAALNGQNHQISSLTQSVQDLRTAVQRL